MSSRHPVLKSKSIHKENAAVVHTVGLQAVQARLHPNR